MDPPLLEAPAIDLEARPWLLHMPYIPPAIIPFHEARNEIRLLLGGTGTSKTTTGSFETACYMTGYNPIRDESYQVPNECWAVCLRLKDQGPIIRDAMARMLPYMRGKDGQLRPGWRYFKQDALFEIKKNLPGAGSILRLKQQEDGPEAFFGGRPLSIWIDEERDGATGERIFNQIMARTTPGQILHIFLTMTPEHGFSWTHQRLYDRTSERLVPGVYVLEVSKRDLVKSKGGFITEEEIKKEEGKWDEYEAAAKIEGRFSPMGTSPFFRAKFIIEQMEDAPQGTPVVLENTLGRYLPQEKEDSIGRLYRSRESGREYVAAWDPSSGVRGDFSVVVVFDRHTLTEVYHASSDRIPPDEFAFKYVLPAANYFNEAKLAVEINGEGGGVALDAVRSYENIYYRTIFDKTSVQGTQSIGWRTTEETRRRAFDSLNKCLCDKKWHPSYQLLQQMGYIVKKPMDRGGFRPDHPDGKHDDHVVAAGIALAVHFEEPIYDWPDLSRLAIRWEGSAQISGQLVP